MRFVDTNVLLYAISTNPAEQAKADVASRVLSSRDLAVSTQVLQEFYVQATRQTRRDRVTHAQAADLVTSFTRFTVQATTVGLVQAAMTTRERFQLSYWDAAIIEAARMIGSAQVLSEDLSHGQDYEGVTVVDPFRGASAV